MLPKKIQEIVDGIPKGDKETLEKYLEKAHRSNVKNAKVAILARNLSHGLGPNMTHN